MNKNNLNKYKCTDETQPKKVRKALRSCKNKKPFVPGSVLILLSGRFRGKRVVYLNTLEDNTLLVTGPFKVNGVPLRRVNPRYVILTSVVLKIPPFDISKYTVSYFAREKKSKTSKKKDFLAESDGDAELPLERKQDQKMLDMVVFRSLENEPLIRKYLGSTFSLKNGDMPHKMRF